jgi:hypothetical protein
MPKKTVEKKIFSIDELNPKKHYKIKIKSFNKDKKLIGESPWIIFKTAGKNQAPPNVSNLNANFTGSALVVTWDGSAARAESDFKNFRIRISSPNQTEIKNFYNESNRFGLNEDENRDLFGTFEGTINITIYSRDSSGNESSGVSITANADVPSDPTNVKLSAAVLGYNVSWDLPTFKNYDYTRIYESSSESGTYTVVRNERGASTYVPKSSLSTVWVKVSHVNKAGAESNLVASVPPSITPIDPVPTDVTPPAVPTSLSWEDAGTESKNGITVAAMRAHWQVSEITSGYKVRVTEDIVNRENWAVYDVPAIKAKVTNKQLLTNVATLTLTAHSFRPDDYVTVFNVGAPFDGKFKITSVTTNTITFNLTGSDVSSQASDGDVIASSFVVTDLYPGTQYYGSILAYDSANNLTQFVSEGTFTTSGVAGTVGKKITIDGTSMAFGPNVSGTNDGLFIDSNNYWYNTGTFKAGTTTNNLSWDGVNLRLDGRVIARSGSFSGNIFMSGTGTIDSNTASLIAAPYLDIQSATLSGGVATIITTTTPSPAWSAGDIVLVSEASIQFDGQYTLLSASGNTFTFSLTNYSSATPITNSGKISRFNTGDRVIFNSSGIQGWEDDEVAFSFNRNKTSRIGGWTIRPSRIFSGSGTTTVGLSSNDASGVRIWAGGSTPSTAPFRVLASGSIRAYGVFSSSDVDSGTRIAIGSDVVGTKDGIVLNETSISGYENFWYIPSTVGTGDTFFQVGTSGGSGISVKRIGNGAGYPKVYIKDYNLEGTNVFEANGILDLGNGIKLGKNLNSSGVDGLILNSDNYWHYNTSDTKYKFRVGSSGTSNYLLFQDGVLTVSGDINVVGGNAATTTQLANKLDSSSFTGINIISAVNSQVLNDNTGNGISIGNTTSGNNIYPRIATLSHLTFSSTGSGFFLGRDSDGIYKFFIGNTNNSLTWNGSNLNIIGVLTTGTTGYYARLTGSSLEFLSKDTAPLSTEQLESSIDIETGLQPRDGSLAPVSSLRITTLGLSIDGLLDVGNISMSGQSTLRGIGDIDTGETIDKVLVRINATTLSEKYLRWAEPSDIGGGGGGTTYTSGDDSEGIIVNNTSDTITNAGYRMVGSTTNGWSGSGTVFGARASTRNRITFGTLPGNNSGRSDGDIHIEF